MTSSFDAKWNRALLQQKDRLRRRKYLGVLNELQYDNFLGSLDQLSRQYNNNLVTTSLEKLRPAFEQLSTFERAISNACQAQANPCSLVWGALQVFITCAVKFLRTLDRVTELLADLTHTLTRVNAWCDLLSRNERLQNLSCEIVSEYVGCCISAVKFYRRNPVVHVVKSLWSDAEKPLRKSQERIARKIADFDAESRLSVDRELLDRIPPRHDLDSRIPKAGIFKVPYSQNPFFFGRDEVLEKLDGIFNVRKQELRRQASCCLVHGLGGMGKSQIALQYAHKNREEYNCIWWFACSPVSELVRQFAQVAIDLQLPGCETAGPGRRFEMARNWLAKTDDSWLLIFDNVEKWDDISAYWPSVNGCAIATSQVISLTGVIRSSVPLKPLSTEDGASLLLNYMREDTAERGGRDAAMTISHAVGGIPIAIAHIAGALVDSQLTLNECAKKFKSHDTTLMWDLPDKPSSLHAYEKKLSMVWDVAYENLSPLARSILNIVSLLNPDNIAESLFMKDSQEQAHTNIQQKLTSPGQQDNVRRDLARKQLIQRHQAGDYAYFSIHRSLQLNLRYKLEMDKDEYQTTFDEAVNIVRLAFPEQDEMQRPANNKWEEHVKFQRHVLALLSTFEHTKMDIVPPGELARLLSDATNYFWEMEDIYQAIRVAESSVKTYKRLREPDLMDIGDAYALWGITSLELGLKGRRTGLECLVETLKARRVFVNAPPPGGTYEEQMLYANSWNDFGIGLIEMGDYTEAEKYIRHSLSIKERHVSIDDDPQLHGEGYKNLALICAFQGRAQEAHTLMKEATRLIEIANGPESGATSKWHFLWANALLVSGYSEDAVSRLEAILEQRQNLFGQFGAPTRDSYCALAAAYSQSGDNDASEKAEKMLGLALQDLDQMPWSEERVARAHFILSQVYDEQRRPEMARAEKKKAHEMLRELANTHKDYLPNTVDDDAILFDHCVAFTSGRFAKGQAYALRLQYEATDIDSSIAELSRQDKALPTHDATQKRHDPNGVAAPSDSRFAINS